MGSVIRFPGRRHATRASAGALAAISASASSVTVSQPRSPASRTKGTQWGAGMPPGRSRQPLTVDFESERASATCLVPPSASMIDPGVTMSRSVVRTTRTCQGFADCETTILPGHVPIGRMVDDPKVIGRRLRALRVALGINKQIDFARSIGVEKQTYNPWEKGARPLTFEGACLIRKRYNIPLDYLFYGAAVGDLPAKILEKINEAA